MIILTSATDTLVAVLGTAKTANDMQCITNWREISTTDYTPGRTVIPTNGVASVLLLLGEC